MSRASSRRWCAGGCRTCTNWISHGPVLLQIHTATVRQRWSCPVNIYEVGHHPRHDPKASTRGAKPRGRSHRRSILILGCRYRPSRQRTCAHLVADRHGRFLVPGLRPRVTKGVQRFTSLFRADPIRLPTSGFPFSFVAGAGSVLGHALGVAVPSRLVRPCSPSIATRPGAHGDWILMWWGATMRSTRFNAFIGVTPGFLQDRLSGGRTPVTRSPNRCCSRTFSPYWPILPVPWPSHALLPTVTRRCQSAADAASRANLPSRPLGLRNPAKIV